MKKAYSDSYSTGLPFSEAIEVNGIIFVSGQIHLDEADNLLEGTIEEKFTQSIRNVEKVLLQADLTLEHVVKVEIFLPNLKRDSEAVNSIYPSFWQHPMPARAMIGVQSLPMGADVEVVVTAAR